MVLREALVEELIEAEKEAFKTGFAAGSTHAIKGVPEFYLVQKEERDKMEFLKFKTLVERKFIYKVDTKSTAIELDLGSGLRATIDCEKNDQRDEWHMVIDTVKR